MALKNSNSVRTRILGHLKRSVIALTMSLALALALSVVLLFVVTETEYRGRRADHKVETKAILHLQQLRRAGYDGEMSIVQKRQLVDERCAEIGDILSLKLDELRCRRLTTELREHFLTFVETRRDETDLRDRIVGAYTHDLIAPLIGRLLQISEAHKADSIVVESKDEDPNFNFVLESDDAEKFKSQYLANNLLSYANEAYVLFLRGVLDRTNEGREIAVLDRLIKRAETIRAKYSDGDNRWLDIAIPNTRALVEITHLYSDAHSRVEAVKRQMAKTFDVLFVLLQSDIRTEVRVSAVSICTYLFGRHALALLTVLSMISTLYALYGLRKLE